MLPVLVHFHLFFCRRLWNSGLIRISSPSFTSQTTFYIKSIPLVQELDQEVVIVVIIRFWSMLKLPNLPFLILNCTLQLNLLHDLREVLQVKITILLVTHATRFQGLGVTWPSETSVA